MTERYIVEISQTHHTHEYISKIIRESLEKIPAINSLTVSVISQRYLKVDSNFQKIVPGV